MLVGDLVYNDDFDINTNYAVFDCSVNTEETWHDKDPVFDSRKKWVKQTTGYDFGSEN